MDKPSGMFAESKNTDYMSGKWRLLPQFVLRQTGFPIELIDALASPSVSEAADALLQALTHMREIRHQVFSLLRTYQRQEDSSSAWQPILAKMRAKVEKGVAIRSDNLQRFLLTVDDQDIRLLLFNWNTVVQQVQNLKLSYADTLNKHLEQASLFLIQLFAQDPRLLDVLLISNEANYDLFEKWLRSSFEAGHPFSRGDRRKVDTLVMYLQRICTKNDTNSHFGPFSLGLVKDSEENISSKRGNILQRVSFYTYWAANHIAQKMSQETSLFGAMKPRRNPLTFLHPDKQEIRCLDFSYQALFENDIERGIRFSQPLSLTPKEMSLLKACDGSKSVMEVFSTWQQEYSESDWETFVRLLQSLDQRGILSLAFEVPVGSQNTLRDLRELLPAQDERWFSLLNEYEHLLQQFVQAKSTGERRALFTTLKDSFHRVTGQSPTRGEGHIYADRSVLFEECLLASDEIQIGGLLAETIERDLSLFYNLLLAAPRYRLVAEGRMLNDWFAARFEPVGQVSLENFLAAFVADAPLLEHHYSHIDAEVDAFLQRVQECILPPSALSQSERHIEYDTLHTVLATYTDFLPAVCNPDVMIGATSYDAIQRGDFKIVIGDCHAAREILSHTSLTPFLEQKFPNFVQEVMELYQSLIRDDEEIADVIRKHASKTAAQAVFPCIDIELYGRSPKSRSMVLLLQDLTVCQTSNGLRLYAPRLQKFLRLMTTGFGSMQMKRNPFDIFGFPRHHSGLVLPGHGLAHIPRISMNHVIVQREIWRVPVQAFMQPLAVGNFQIEDSNEGGFLRVKQVRAQYKLPRYVFAKIAHEPKVIYVDFDAPLLVRQLQRLIRQARGYIEFSEMFPGPGQFWLTSSQGSHTCELRFAVFSRRER